MKMPTPPNPEAIRFEAQKAAWLYDTVIQGCPYPFGTEAARIFKTEFDIAKQAQADAGAPAPKVPSPNQNKMADKYDPPARTYYRNNGNVHVPSAGVPC
jgi:hypothetical protein